MTACSALLQQLPVTMIILLNSAVAFFERPIFLFLEKKICIHCTLKLFMHQLMAADNLKL